ncbi:MAG TPA: M28 family peptidase [Gemmatimonadales bacterium]|nr:M28 family peptidase [Gemmatimonadales bacterium]
MRRPHLAFTLAALLAACGGTTSSVAPPAPSAATTAAITAQDLRTRISIFADDSMQGRRTGTPGNAKGNAYIAAELRRLGLRPAGDSGSFLQRVPLMRFRVDSAGATLRAGSASLALWEYYPYQPDFHVPVRPVSGAPVVYIGGAADASSLPPRDSLKGKVVLFRSDVDGGNTLGAPDLSPGGSLGLIAGIMVTGADPLIATFDQVFRTPPLIVHDSVQVPPGVTQPRIIILPTASVAKLFGRPLDALKPGDATPPLAGEVKFEGTDLGATNVVAILEGSDPARRGEYVALGAHNDAIGIVSPVEHDSLRAYNAVVRPRGANDTPREPTAAEAARIRSIIDSLRKIRPARIDSIVNGADDDGSGSMGLLEIAEAASRAEHRPARSLLFVWHTGEESGLQGSRWFTDHPTVPRDSIVAQVNIDMIARGGPQDEKLGGPGYIQAIGTRRLSSELGDLAEQVDKDGKYGLVFDYTYDADGHPDNFYCRSDHYMYARYGIPIAFFSTGGHRDYHQVTDEVQYLDFTKYTTVTRFVADLAGRLADLDHRPVVDKPKPDPKAPCKQ